MALLGERALKKIAILLDGGFVLKQLYKLLGKRHPVAGEVLAFAKACALQDEEIFRIYYYDCPPFPNDLVNPLAPKTPIHFGKSTIAIRMQRLQQELASMDLVAFRRGELRCSGWGLSWKTRQALLTGVRAPEPLTAHDLVPEFRQKKVDMNIGLDVAWLASRRIVDRIVLVTGDEDFVPAMKFARREGTQVVLVPMGSKLLKEALRQHADYVREVPSHLFPAAPTPAKKPLQPRSNP
jgi:uncharacterized LabA/DUF88 family protein